MLFTCSRIEEMPAGFTSLLKKHVALYEHVKWDAKHVAYVHVYMCVGSIEIGNALRSTQTHAHLSIISAQSNFEQ